MRNFTTGINTKGETIEIPIENNCIYCNNIGLISLDLKGLENLEILSCWDNKLTFLDLKDCKNLKKIDCLNNNLSFLELKGLNKLEYLDCFSNQLISLDITGLQNLKYLDCYNNLLLTSLTNTKGKTFNVKMIDFIPTIISNQWDLFKDNIFINNQGQAYNGIEKGEFIWKDCFIGWDKKHNHFAYGETIREAFNDLLFKSCERNKKQYESLTLDSILPFDEAIIFYRVITEVSSMETEDFITSIIGEKNIKENYTIQEIIDLNKDYHTFKIFNDFFQKYVGL